MGVHPREFWELTPLEVSLIIGRKLESDSIAWNHTGSLICAYYNSKQSKRTYSPDDFNPHKSKPAAPKTKEEISALTEKLRKFK